MSRQDEKRQLRETKRELKRAGRKKARARARHLLETAPEDAHLAEDDYGRYTTAHLNGMDRDATRRPRPDDREPPQPDRSDP
ncbi:hypothetical protein [Tautonia plasticadhaerens]|uniref:Uncharacterized protein n=1 Tax=Tautonia plasticadhaerens TaxID=2527974 RepID=A0A518H797_9BACT|nr:hypothetical protein [Tautonia plasticadhaerens]QDV36730.1 hypothetical protein ElP_46590 [Tautonia plasticadhaerens]